MGLPGLPENGPERRNHLCCEREDAGSQRRSQESRSHAGQEAEGVSGKGAKTIPARDFVQAEIMEKMGWQQHTVREFMAGVMKKAGYTVESFKPEGGERTYHSSTSNSPH